ncbi:hypothetical protein BT63DRAFT_461416 [Microthyrium microscopicum]|uniref:Uncharacterized protein n=1 Tax=Microthyrium microscopicum TaxID=703497 RepID=A0A6A6TXC5_9PEZI|nr:hypothetical protein BT63DRAFT_461416 [Microthyrium microscopicum]
MKFQTTALMAIAFAMLSKATPVIDRRDPTRYAPGYCDTSNPFLPNGICIDLAESDNQQACDPSLGVCIQEPAGDVACFVDPSQEWADCAH